MPTQMQEPPIHDDFEDTGEGKHAFGGGFNPPPDWPAPELELQDYIAQPGGRHGSANPGDRPIFTPWDRPEDAAPQDPMAFASDVAVNSDHLSYALAGLAPFVPLPEGSPLRDFRPHRPRAIAGLLPRGDFIPSL